MKLIFCLKILLLYSFTCISQIVSNHHIIGGEFFGFEGFSLLDHNEDYMLFKVDENVTAIGTTPLSFSENTDEALVVITAEMEIISMIEIKAGTIRDATINSNNRIAFYATADQDETTIINQSTEIIGPKFFMSLDLSGNILWLKDNIEMLSSIYNFIEIAEDNSVYYTGSVIANIDEESFSFAGEEFLSTATDSQFPFNTITLKFSPTGEELWGNLITGNDFNRPLGMAIGADGRVTISGIHDDENLNINGNNYYGSGSFTVTYNSSGEEIWHYFLSHDDPWEIQNSNFFKLNYSGNNLTTAIYITGDSLFINNDTIVANCTENYIGLFTRFNENGEVAYLEDFGNMGGSFRTGMVLYNDELYIIASSSVAPRITIDCENYEFPENIWEVYLFKINMIGESEILFKYSSPMLTNTDRISDFDLAKIGDKFFINTTFNGLLQAENFEIGNGEFFQSVILELSDVNSVTENKPESSFNVYPNPSSGIISVKSSVDGKINIYNSNGKSVYSGPLNKDESINLTHIRSGVYYARFMDKAGEVLHSKKLMVLE